MLIAVPESYKNEKLDVSDWTAQQTDSEDGSGEDEKDEEDDSDDS